MLRTPRASNGPNHLGLCALQSNNMLKPLPSAPKNPFQPPESVFDERLRKGDFIKLARLTPKVLGVYSGHQKLEKMRPDDGY